MVRPLKDKTIRPTRPNAGVQAAYQKRLDALIAEMHRSLVWFVSAAYKANEPAIMALDRTPAQELSASIRKLRGRWLANFDELAKKTAPQFAEETLKYSDTALRASLKKAGFTVEFKTTPAVRDAYQAIIGENVGLIKSIAEEHLTQVEGMVMRSVQAGRDLGYLSKELQDRYGITKRRAALIARDQNNKATAVITRVRQRELGITEAIWLHSYGGKHPRASHIAADGKRYDVEKGMLIDGEWIFPGEKINCRCVSKSILPIPRVS
jgi:SPP1 gp7 family putative phage head morphogenesis protein